MLQHIRPKVCRAGRIIPTRGLACLRSRRSIWKSGHLPHLLKVIAQLVDQLMDSLPIVGRSAVTVRRLVVCQISPLLAPVQDCHMNKIGWRMHRLNLTSWGKTIVLRYNTWIVHRQYRWWYCELWTTGVPAFSPDSSDFLQRTNLTATHEKYGA